MRSYLTVLFFVALIGGLCLVLLPEEKREDLHRPVRFLAALCLLLALGSPLRELPDRLADLRGRLETLAGDGARESEFVAQFQAGMTALEAAEVAEGLAGALGELYGVSPGAFSVQLATGEERTVYLRLRGEGLLLDPAEVEATVQELLGAACQVYY